MFLPNWVGIFDDPLMPKRGRGRKGGGGWVGMGRVGRILTETLKMSDH